VVTVYLDSAIIVKLLVREAGSDWFNRALQGQALESSELALTEVRSALLAKERAGNISSRERTSSTARFLTMVEDDALRLFALSRDLLNRASAIQLACHPKIPLRTLDALHIATCDLHHSGTLSTTDTRMRAACEQLGIALLPAKPQDLKSIREFDL
jgi:predicted nucleic acid-binding protein